MTDTAPIVPMMTALMALAASYAVLGTPFTVIEELNRVRTSLHRLARECGSGSRGPCPILTAFEAD